MAPGLVTAIALAMLARFTASSKLLKSDAITLANVPMKVSPAAVVSCATTFSGCAHHLL